jgi:hypothetical protein
MHLTWMTSEVAKQTKGQWNEVLRHSMMMEFNENQSRFLAPGNKLATAYLAHPDVSRDMANVTAWA